MACRIPTIFRYGPALVCAALLLISLPVPAQQSETLDPRVAQDLLSAYEKLEEDQYEAALQDLDRLINRRGENMKPFDKASVLQIRGTAHVNLENLDAALADFEAALLLNALPEEQQNRLRFNVAQLYFVSERYEDSIRLFEEWMKGEVEVTHTTYFMLSAAHYNLENMQRAVEPIQTAIEIAPEPQRRYYDLLNVLYSNLERIIERTGLLETMVELWPNELSYWRQLSSLYSEQGDQMKAFAALESAYIHGLIEEQSDIILLVQYYSTFDNPHRGAELLEQEMQDGRVERNVDHLELLSQLWSQAREHRKAIPVLREAARMSDEGVLSFRLGQSLLASEDNEAAEVALEAALEKGGLDDQRRAEAYLLLGNARFNQAGPGDRDQRMAADRAFAQAERFASSRRQASDWRGYIEAINQTERRQASLEQEQSERLATAAQERLLTGCRAQQLAGSQLSERCQRILAQAEEGDG